MLYQIDYKAPKVMLGNVVGIDVCGTIVSVGGNVSSEKLRVGDLVFGPAKVPSSGSIAEYAVAEAFSITKVPANWSVEEAAVTPVAYCTAMTGFERAGLLDKYDQSSGEPPVDSILVIGSSGGTGLAGLHLAKCLGIKRIIGICSAKNARFCKDQGATEIVPYDEKETLQSFLRDNAGAIDLIYDTATSSGGGEQYSKDPSFLNLLKAKKDRTQPPSYLVLNGGKRQWFKKAVTGRPTFDPRVLLYMTKYSTWRLNKICELMNKAGVKPVVSHTYALKPDDIQAGYQALKSRRTKGKIAIKISNPHLESNKEE